MRSVRTRFAPSPTGFLHVGNIRTALFAYLVARHAGGQFVLRIEDTDQKRFIEGSADRVIDSLRLLDIDYDEGPDTPGEYGPYFQSLRLSTYQDWAKILVDSGRAYADPYTPGEVQAFREAARAAKQPFLYRNHRPEHPPVWDGSQPLRFRSEPKNYTWNDAVMGDMHAGSAAIDDFILMKSDGFPTYNFAHIIDDYEMQISHVIRSQEFIASIPNYLNLYEALGFEKPVLAIVPPVMASTGTKKLSKRDGAKDVLDYAREGYLPEALVNFIASLGWNDGTEQEIFTLAELISKFDLARVQHAGARFDENRLQWMNGVWIRSLNLDELYQRSRPFWGPEASDATDEMKRDVLALVQERLKYLGEIPGLTNFFFTDLPVNPELITGNKQLKKFEASELKNLLEQARGVIAASNFTVQDLNDRLNGLLETTGQKPGVLFSLIRIATTQAPSSPGLADTLHVLGRETILRRIDATLSAL